MVVNEQMTDQQTQLFEDAEQVMLQTDENGVQWYRQHSITVSSQEWNDGKCRIAFRGINELGTQHDTMVFLSEEQSSKVRDAKDGNQQYMIGVVIGNQKNNPKFPNDGSQLWNYYWNCKSFEGVVSENTVARTPVGGYKHYDNVTVRPNHGDDNSVNDLFPSVTETPKPQERTVIKTSAYDDKQLEINLAMCFKSAVEIYISKGHSGGVETVKKIAAELMEKLQELRSEYGLTTSK